MTQSMLGPNAENLMYWPFLGGVNRLAKAGQAAGVNAAAGQRFYFVYGPTGLLLAVVNSSGQIVWQNGPGAGDAFGNGIIGAPTPFVGPGTYQNPTGQQSNPNGGMNGTVNPGTGSTPIDGGGTRGLGSLGDRLRFGTKNLLKAPQFQPGSEGRQFFANAMRMIPVVGAAYSGYAAATNHDPIAGTCETPLQRAMDAFNFAGGLHDIFLSGTETGGAAAGGKLLSRAERLNAFYERLNALPHATSPGEALEQIRAMLKGVEDEFSGIAHDPVPGLGKQNGRMYPPFNDSVRINSDGSLTGVTAKNIIELGSNGSIVIIVRKTGQIVFSKAGGG